MNTKKHFFLNVLRHPTKSGFEAVTCIWIIKKLSDVIGAGGRMDWFLGL